MKKNGAGALAVIFCGCFLGAGFLSGNELLQFFGNFGVLGIVGCVLSVFLIAFFCAQIIAISAAKKTENPERIILPGHLHKSSMLFGVLQAILIFSIIVIMISGSATLLSERFLINRLLAGALFTALLAVAALCGIKGMVKVLSFLVPIIIAFSLIISLVLLFKTNFSVTLTANYNHKNSFLKNWLLSALAYLSYSIFSSVGVFAVYGDKLKSKNTKWIGTFMGAALMLTVAVAIILAISATPKELIGELPMLSAAFFAGAHFGYIYAFLLLFGMFAAALTSMLSLIHYIKVKFALNCKGERILTVVLSVCSFLGSIFGFGDLVGTIYPIFGYLGIAVLIMLLINFYHIKILNRRHV